MLRNLAICFCVAIPLQGIVWHNGRCHRHAVPAIRLLFGYLTRAHDGGMMNLGLLPYDLVSPACLWTQRGLRT